MECTVSDNVHYVNFEPGWIESGLPRAGSRSPLPPIFIKEVRFSDEAV